MSDSFITITEEIEKYLKDLVAEKDKCNSKEEEDLVMLKLDVLQELGNRIVKRMGKKIDQYFFE